MLVDIRTMKFYYYYYDHVEERTLLVGQVSELNWSCLYSILLFYCIRYMSIITFSEILHSIIPLFALRIYLKFRQIRQRSIHIHVEILHEGYRYEFSV